MRRFVLATVCSVGCLACGDDDPAAPPPSTSTATSSTGGAGGMGGTGGGGTGAGSFVLQVPAWEPCSLDSTDTNDDDAECVAVDVPAAWDDPSGPTIQVFVKRYLSAQQPASTQVWLLAGGPGYASDSWDNKIAGIGDLLEGVDFYMIDHRGTGRSTRLGCDAEEDDDSEAGLDISAAEWPSCLASVEATWGDTLAEFTTTRAAEDVANLIDALRGDQQVGVAGLSYGTYWALRYLAIAPDQADLVQLDAIAPPGTDFATYDQGVNDVGLEFLDRCADDAVCASKLGPDPAAAAEQAMIDVYELGLCPEVPAAGLDRALMRGYLFGLLNTYDLRPLVAPMLYRLGRCEPGDIEVFQHFADLALAPQLPSLQDRYYSSVLHDHVMFSELWIDPATQAEHDALVGTFVFSSYDTTSSFDRAERWPVYPLDPAVGTWGRSSVPILAFNGDLDPATPLLHAQQVTRHYDGPNQSFFVMPGASHGGAGQPTTSGAPCGVSALLTFFTDPLAEPDLSCIPDILPVQFAPTPAESQSWFGTSDPWENAAAPPVPPRPPAEMERAARELRRLIRTR